MSIETLFRIIFAIFAVGMAGLLGAMLITGRSSIDGRAADRGTEPGAYWGAVGMTAILVATLAVVAILPMARHVLPLLFLGFLGGQLFETLLSGASAAVAGRTYLRATQPRAYWRSVAVNAVLVSLALAFLTAELTKAL